MVTFHSKEIINLWTDFHSSFQIQQKIRCLIKAAFLPKHTNLGLQLGDHLGDRKVHRLQKYVTVLTFLTAKKMSNEKSSIL